MLLLVLMVVVVAGGGGCCCFWLLVVAVVAVVAVVVVIELFVVVVTWSVCRCCAYYGQYVNVALLSEHTLSRSTVQFGYLFSAITFQLPLLSLLFGAT